MYLEYKAKYSLYCRSIFPRQSLSNALAEVSSKHKLFGKRSGLVRVSISIRDSIFWSLGRIAGYGGPDIADCVIGNCISITLSCVMSSFDTSHTLRLHNCSCPYEKNWDNLTRDLFDTSYWAAEPRRNVFVFSIVVRHPLHFNDSSSREAPCDRLAAVVVYTRLLGRRSCHNRVELRYFFERSAVRGSTGHFLALHVCRPPLRAVHHSQQTRSQCKTYYSINTRFV
jgi:hypothetical protein